EYWIVESGTYLEHPHLSGVFSGLPLVHGPFLLLYTYYLIYPEQTWDRRSWLHFLPFLAYQIYASFAFFFIPAADKLVFMQQLLAGNPPLHLFIWGQIKAVQGLVYMILILVLLRRHQIRLQANFSNTEALNLRWLRILATGLLIIYALALVNTLLVWQWNLNLEAMIGLAATLFVLLAGFFAMRQGTLFGPEVSPQRLVPEKYMQSRLTQTDVLEQKRRVQTYLEEEEPYLNPDFSIQQLSDALGLPVRDLSQVINEGFQKNFFTLINGYRIEVVKERIRSQEFEHLTLLAIGLSCGFNSKTTFNTVFKKMTDQTPSQFKKTLESVH
ncbi:MAG: helix-turn-helix transcriptional regulator, partial [Phaeodactylibacter sp.]|nr:helix-turn-helix transcriptional regulator [Phaeodactylibacter sp.]